MNKRKFIRRRRVRARTSPIDRLARYTWIICESIYGGVRDILGFSSRSKYDQALVSLDKSTSRRIRNMRRTQTQQERLEESFSVGQQSKIESDFQSPQPLTVPDQDFVSKSQLRTKSRVHEPAKNRTSNNVLNLVSSEESETTKVEEVVSSVVKKKKNKIMSPQDIMLLQGGYSKLCTLLQQVGLLWLKQAVVLLRLLGRKKNLWQERYPVMFKQRSILVSLPTFSVGVYAPRLCKYFRGGMVAFATLASSIVSLVYNGWQSIRNYIGRLYRSSLQSNQFNNSRQSETAAHKTEPSKEVLAKPSSSTRSQIRNTMNAAKQKVSRKKKQSSTRSRLRVWLSRAFFGFLVLSLLVGGVFFIWVASLEIPDSNIDDRVTAQSTKIYDETGTVLLHDVYKDERRTVVTLSEISDNMKKAIMATEDDEFYEHKGYDISAIMRGVCYEVSAVVNMRTFGGFCPRGGGSTITQQVIKNTLLNDDRKLERKIKEVVLARKLEGQKTKNEILEIYLNEIAFGGPIYGVQQASLSYFAKPASELTIAESAYLAALPKAPTTYLNNRAKFDGRQQFILGRMRKLGYISQQEYQSALDEEVVFVEKVDKGIKAPHFVFYVLDEFNQAQEESTNDLSYNGYNIRTTLNWELQSRLEEVASSSAARITEKYKASNVALVVVENKTGKIRAMIGSKDYFAEDIDGKFNVATALRQPGSTFKPFVYANAFDKGYLPETIVWDTNTEFSTSCYPDGEPQLPQYRDRCYNPQNFDKRYRGPVSLRSALAQSLNIPAVKLLYLVGVADAMNFAKQLGISSLNRAPSFYGLNLVLGGGEVRLVDMVVAYSVFGAGGVRHAPAAWEEVTDADEKIVAQYQDKSERVVSAQTAAMVSQVLSDDNAKRPMFGSNSPLYYGAKDVAVKTGTTNNFRDVWTIGYTTDVTVGVWAGNNDNTPLAKSPSSSVVGPFWREAMDVALEFYGAKSFANYNKESEGLLPVLTGNYEGGGIVYLDPNTGEIVDKPTAEELAAGLYVPQGTVEYHSILHYVDKKNPRAGQTTNPRSDGLYEHFEHGVQQWTEQKGWAQRAASSTVDSLLEQIAAEQGINTGDIKNSSGDSPSQEVELDFAIRASQVPVPADERMIVSIDITGDSTQIDTIYYYINNSYLESGTYRKTSIQVTPSSVRSLSESNTVKVVVQTKDGRKIERTTTLRITQ